jgi:DNA-binding LytR/AlgR family response regulator
MNQFTCGNGRLKTLVVEDERPARDYLVELLVDTNQVEIVAAVATAEEARQVLGASGLEVDVAFVDIHLAAADDIDAGLGIVREFSRTKGAPAFVLATALRQHAAEAFDLDVADFLLKPFVESRISDCLSKIARRRSRPTSPPPTRLVARSEKGLVFLKRAEAWAFEANDRLTFVHSAMGRFDIDLSLAAIEATLGLGWLRVHRNWVVNVEHVKALERDELGSALILGETIHLPGSLRVPVAREKVHGVRQALLDGAAGIRR